MDDYNKNSFHFFEALKIVFSLKVYYIITDNLALNHLKYFERLYSLRL